MPHVPYHKEPTQEYLDSQRQRLLERRIRQAKRLLAVAITPAAQAAAAAQVRACQKALRDFIDETGRRRLPYREQLREGTPK